VDRARLVADEQVVTDPDRGSDLHASGTVTRRALRGFVIIVVTRKRTMRLGSSSSSTLVLIFCQSLNCKKKQLLRQGHMGRGKAQCRNDDETSSVSKVVTIVSV
jgi:hypothetical protein